MRIVVGMSGGVDSSVTAALLKAQGHEVTGVTMRLWDGSVALPAGAAGGCFGPGEAEDIAAAQACCESLGISHRVVDLAAEYRSEVLEYVCGEYRSGRTPNPCVRCNRAIKFGGLLRRIREQGLEFDRFATGHYARVAPGEPAGRVRLFRGVDRSKDQSYFLSRLRQDQLAVAMFPLGGMTKVEVRRLAAARGWGALVEKPESQDFLDGGRYDVLFQGRARPGPIVDLDGRRVGEHRGIEFYTVGQRKGLGIGGLKKPLYVVRLDAAANTVVVGPFEALFGRELRAVDLNWVGLAAAAPAEFRVEAQIRQQHRAAPAVARASGGGVDVRFDEPQMSVTPGQTVVLYREDEVMASGIIET